MKKIFYLFVVIFSFFTLLLTFNSCSLIDDGDDSPYKMSGWYRTPVQDVYGSRGCKVVHFKSSKKLVLYDTVLYGKPAEYAQYWVELPDHPGWYYQMDTEKPMEYVIDNQGMLIATGSGSNYLKEMINDDGTFSLGGYPGGKLSKWVE